MIFFSPEILQDGNTAYLTLVTPVFLIKVQTKNNFKKPQNMEIFE